MLRQRCASPFGAPGVALYARLEGRGSAQRMLLPSAPWRTRGQDASSTSGLLGFAIPSPRAVHHAPFTVMPPPAPCTVVQDAVDIHPDQRKRHRRSRTYGKRQQRIRTAWKHIIPAVTIRRIRGSRGLGNQSSRGSPRALLTKFSIRQLGVSRERRHLARRQLLPFTQDESLENDGLDIDEYGQWSHSAESPSLDEATHLTAAVQAMGFELDRYCNAIVAEIQISVKGLQEILGLCGLPGSPAVSHSIEMRMRTLAHLQTLQIQVAKESQQLKTLCHFYRGIVRAASGIPKDVDATIYASERRRFLLLYRENFIKNLSAQLRADAQDPALDTINGFDATKLRKRLREFDTFIKRGTFAIIRTAARRLHLILCMEAGGDGLGHLHMEQSWGSRTGLRALRALLVRPIEPVHRGQYSTLTTREVSILNDWLDTLQHNLRDILKSVNRLSWVLLDKAAMAGRSGALDPFASSIRNQMIMNLKAEYRREAITSVNKLLQRMGYKPSRWCKRQCLGRKAPSRMSRRKPRLQARKYSEALAAQFHVTYYWVSGESDEPWADTTDFWGDHHDVRDPIAVNKGVRFVKIDSRAAEIHPRAAKFKMRIRNIMEGRKSKRVVISRDESRKKRVIALQKLRRVLSATLLSSQNRTFKTLSSVDLLASLPEANKPSNWSQVGKTITALGFYNSLGEESTDWSTRMEPLKKDSGEDNVRWSSSKAKPRRVLAQSKPPFQATQPMRAPHSTTTLFISGAWEPSVDVSSNAHTNADTNDQGSLIGGNSGTASSCGTSGDATSEKQPHMDSSGDHNPGHTNYPPQGQNSPPPDESMDRPMNDDSPDESEHEEDPESEVDEDSKADEPEEEKHTPLTYQIPPDVLDSALQAPAQTRASYWSQKLYRGPEDQELSLHYCVTMDVSERVAKHFLNEKVVGFDIEWKPFGPVNIKENASLIQLATEDRIALFHIARFPGKTAEQLMPPTLKAVLESADTMKVGVAVKGDCKRLETHFDLNVRGVFELSRLYNLVEYYGSQPSKVNNKLVKLAAQVKQHLLLPLHKGEPFVDEPEQRLGSVRESDWSRPLDVEQIHYAAADAYAGFRLFDVLESKRKKLKPAPPMPRLCDYDNKPVPRTTPRAKRTKQARPELKKVVAEALGGLQADDAEEEMYETAPEELEEEDESEDTESEAGSESSEFEDSDADYVPKSHGRIALGQHSTDASANPGPSGHRVGRVSFSKLAGIQPAYPTLPSMPAEENTSSDESEAFDPPPKVPRRRAEKAVRTAEVPPVEAAESEDEFPDTELEDAFATMDLAEPPKSTNNSIAEPAPQAETMSEEEAPRSTDVSPPTLAPLIQLDVPLHTPEYTIATTWAQNYLTSTIPPPGSTAPSRVRATVSPLRAYHIWHHQRVPLDSIGAHLRSPPLAQSTVSNYIIQAITMEKLEYRDADLVSLMGTLPASLRLGRHEWLSRKLGILR